MGITKELIEKALDQLAIEDEAIVIGRTIENYISFIGFNNYNSELFNEIDWQLVDYDSFLTKACKYENFIHVLSGNFMMIKNLNDFKKLYTELSKKESLAYCSPEMHEQFTNLFIEYKEFVEMNAIGIYGGTFDPIHIGHLITAQAVKEIRNLEKIIFIPAYISPHKTDRTSEKQSHRLNMVKLAIEEFPCFRILRY